MPLKLNLPTYLESPLRLSASEQRCSVEEIVSKAVRVYLGLRAPVDARAHSWCDAAPEMGEQRQ